ncbi:hypothetical protein ABT282_08705 [Streptomyces sp. NPDC000927]|uniref:hypothetical protein n=1 Tax=Streptomyces sp. NPDC000927 TaxID=3154371 RepID=UPI003331A6A7
MNRLKQAWAVLAGHQQALNITAETAERVHSEAARYRMKVNDFVSTALDVHEEEVGHDLDFMIREKDLMDETKSVINGTRAGVEA